ncbi:phage head closure protein [Acinetobacter sp. NIPH 1852]|uniref:phage head closure protein n=1 Tax=Acinetobacter sp. NIPH 1852 TaxID=2923428 RepID=UPI001F4A24FD|nr:phage head closure protein [Acinetobacter sp. NIPH 1852]MCH7307570.1 phage head closure protein [Acinetobacter sp. NIPH 1852]
MEFGKLKHRITVQKYTESQDDNNPEYLTKEWIEYCTVWADVQDLSTRDTLQAQSIGSTLQARAVIRFSTQAAAINSTMRILFDSKFYQINGDPKRDLHNRKTYITIELSEGLKEWMV